MKFDLYEKFLRLEKNSNIQYLIEGLDSVLKVYYGISFNGDYRIAFLSKHESKISSKTENIGVECGFEGDDFWTCFDLKDKGLLQSFCTLGENLISCIEHEYNELNALQKIKNRFNSWVKLFKKNTKHISDEEIKGLFGELYCLKEIIAPKYGYQKAILGWGGPENLSKDFAIDDTWYEIKTTNVSSAVVKISSIQQLESDIVGHLIVVKVEEMAKAFEHHSSVKDLYQSILDEINDDEIKDEFLSRLSDNGFSILDENFERNFSVHSVKVYLVDENFPILKLTNEQEETILNAHYELILDKIEKFVEE